VVNVRKREKRKERKEKECPSRVHLVTCHPFPPHGHLLKGPECVPLSLATVSGLTVTFFDRPRRWSCCSSPTIIFQNAHKLSPPIDGHSATPNVPFPLSFPLASLNLVPVSCPAVTHYGHIAKLCAHSVSHLFCVPGCPSLLGPINIAKPLPGTVHYCMYVVLFVPAFGLMAFQVSHRC